MDCRKHPYGRHSGCCRVRLCRQRFGSVLGQGHAEGFGVVGGITALLVATWVAITGLLLNSVLYQTLFTVYAVGIVVIVIGVFCNLVLIGKVPRKQVAPKKADSEEKPAQAAPELPGFTFAETLKKGPSIFCFLIAMFCIAWCATGVTAYSTVFYTSFGMAATTAALLLSVYTYSAAVLKLASGFLVKKLGLKKMSMCIYLGFAIGMVMLAYLESDGRYRIRVHRHGSVRVHLLRGHDPWPVRARPVRHKGLHGHQLRRHCRLLPGLRVRAGRPCDHYRRAGLLQLVRAAGCFGGCGDGVHAYRRCHQPHEEGEEDRRVGFGVVERKGA